jgi:hypothetical protein
VGSEGKGGARDLEELLRADPGRFHGSSFSRWWTLALGLEMGDGDGGAEPSSHSGFAVVLRVRLGVVLCDGPEGVLCVGMTATGIDQWEWDDRELFPETPESVRDDQKREDFL